MTGTLFRLAALWLAVLPAAARADELSLNELVASVRDRYPLVEAARQEQRAAEGEWKIAQGGFDPSLRARLLGEPVSGYPSLRFDTQLEQPVAPFGLNLFGGYRLGLGTFADYDGKLQTNDGGELRAGAGLSLLRNRGTDRRRTTLRRADLGRELASAAYDAQLLETSRTAAYRYWDWVAAGARVAIARELWGVAQQRDAWLVTRIAAGESPAIDRVDNARAIEQRKQAVVAAERARDQAAIELSLLWRDDDGQPRLAGIDRLPKITEPSRAHPGEVDVLLPAAIERRPDVRRVRVQRLQAEAESALADNQLLPALDASVAVSQDLGTSSDSDLKRGKTVVEGGLMLDVPLQQRLLKGRRLAAEATVERIRAQERLTVDRVRADLLDASSAFMAAKGRLDSARIELKAAREVEAGERLRYEHGESNLIFVNLREQQTAETALREVDALVDLRRACALVDTAQGFLPASD